MRHYYAIQILPSSFATSIYDKASDIHFTSILDAINVLQFNNCSRLVTALGPRSTGGVG